MIEKDDKVICINLERCEALKGDVEYTVKGTIIFRREKIIYLNEFPFYGYSQKFFKKVKK